MFTLMAVGRILRSSLPNSFLDVIRKTGIASDSNTPELQSC